MIIKHRGVVEADIRVATLADSAPLYHRPYVEAPPPQQLLAEWIAAPSAILPTLVSLMGSPALCSRAWIWQQYDHMVMGDTVIRPGGDSAVVRVHGTNKAVAMTCDVTPRYVAADPEMGTKQAGRRDLAQLMCRWCRPGSQSPTT